MVAPRRGVHLSGSELGLTTLFEHDLSDSSPSGQWGDDVSRTLQDCCSRRGVALIVAHDVQGVCEARFAELTTDGVCFDLGSQQNLPSFRSMSLCTVSFHHESRLRLFVTRVAEYQPPRNGSTPGRLRVSLPQHLTAQDARLTARIPVSENAGLEVRVKKVDGEVYQATPLNLSMSGILFELPQAWLEPDSDVEVELRLGTTSVALPGVVRRQHRETCFGVMFPSAVEGDAVSAPPGLRQIVTELEGRWIRRPSGYPTGT